jgi:hypothetical protein
MHKDGKVQECGVCRYSFVKGDDYVVLKCNQTFIHKTNEWRNVKPESHMIHKFCIERWFKRLEDNNNPGDCDRGHPMLYNNRIPNAYLAV